MKWEQLFQRFTEFMEAFDQAVSENMEDASSITFMLTWNTHVNAHMNAHLNVYVPDMYMIGKTSSSSQTS